MTRYRKRATVAVLVGALLGLALLACTWRKRPSADSGLRLANFRLADTVGKEVSLADFSDKKAIVVVFIGVECPLVNHYLSRLAEIQTEFGVQVLAIRNVTVS